MKGWCNESYRHALAAHGIPSKSESNIEFWNRMVREQKEYDKKKKLRSDRRRRAVEIIKQIQSHRGKILNLKEELIELTLDENTFSYDERIAFYNKYKVYDFLEERE